MFSQELKKEKKKDFARTKIVKSDICNRDFKHDSFSKLWVQFNVCFTYKMPNNG